MSLFTPVSGPAQQFQAGTVNLSLLSHWTVSARQALLPGQLVSSIKGLLKKTLLFCKMHVTWFCAPPRVKLTAGEVHYWDDYWCSTLLGELLVQYCVRVITGAVLCSDDYLRRVSTCAVLC